MFVAVAIQHAKRMPRIISLSVACSTLTYFCRLSHKRPDFRKKKTLTINLCLDILYKIVWNISHSEKNPAR